MSSSENKSKTLERLENIFPALSIPFLYCLTITFTPTDKDVYVQGSKFIKKKHSEMKVKFIRLINIINAEVPVLDYTIFNLN